MDLLASILCWFAVVLAFGFLLGVMVCAVAVFVGAVMVAFRSPGASS